MNTTQANNGFPPTSRYATTPVASLEDASGTEVVYLTRRFVPAPGTLAQIREHIVHSGDRLDNVATQQVGDPAQFWQLADANAAFEPAQLVEEPGRRLRVTLPAGVPAMPPF